MEVDEIIESDELLVDDMNKVYDFDLDPEIVAENQNCVVVYPEPNQLQIDIDSDEEFEKYKNRLEIIQFKIPELEIEDIVVTPSKSGLPHRHITITIKGKEFSTLERIVYQLMFGSHYMRESLNALRYVSGMLDVSRFFEPKIEV